MSQIDKFKDTITEIAAAAEKLLDDVGIGESTSFILVAIDRTNNPNNRVIAFSDLCEDDVEAVLRGVISSHDGIGAVMGSA